MGATPAGVLRFRLPLVDLSVTYLLDRVAHTATPALDTVLIEPDADRVQLVWRAVLPCDKKALRVSAVRVAIDGLDTGGR